MSPPATLMNIRTDLPALRRRLARLERRCAALWADEPTAHADRETAYSELCDIEQRIVGLILRTLGQPDDDGLVPAIESCERELTRVTTYWSTPRAA